MDTKLKQVGMDAHGALTYLKGNMDLGVTKAQKSNLQQQDDDAVIVELKKQLANDSKIASIQVRHAREGIRVIDTADKALSQVATYLERMSELAWQVMQGVYSTTQRSALQNGFSALGSEVNHLSDATVYRGKQLLDGDDISIELQKRHRTRTIDLFVGIDSDLVHLGLSTSDAAPMTYSITGATIADGQSAAGWAADAVDLAYVKVRELRGELAAARDRLQESLKGDHFRHRYSMRGPWEDNVE